MFKITKTIDTIVWTYLDKLPTSKVQYPLVPFAEEYGLEPTSPLLKFIESDIEPFALKANPSMSAGKLCFVYDEIKTPQFNFKFPELGNYLSFKHNERLEDVVLWNFINELSRGSGILCFDERNFPNGSNLPRSSVRRIAAKISSYATEGEKVLDGSYGFIPDGTTDEFMRHYPTLESYIFRIKSDDESSDTPIATKHTEIKNTTYYKSQVVHGSGINQGVAGDQSSSSITKSITNGTTNKKSILKTISIIWGILGIIIASWWYIMDYLRSNPSAP